MLGFNTIPETNGVAADFVIGQEYFTSSNTDGDGLVSLGGPQNMQVVGDQFYILAYDSNRIIVSDTIPTETGQLIPSFVIGQEDSTSTDSSCTANSLNSPESFIIANNKLIVTDNSNNRILIWNSLPTASGVEADVVIGHNNFTCHNAEEEMLITAEPISIQSLDVEDTVEEDDLSLSSPSGVWSDGKMLSVADSDNNRVLLWHTFPATNNAKPDLILGADLLTGTTITETTVEPEVPVIAEVSATAQATTVTEATVEIEELTQLDNPYHLHSNGNQLFLSDNSNHRLLIWNSLPTTSNQQPDVILGQSNFFNTANNDGNQDGVTDKLFTATEEEISEQDVASSRTLSNPRGAYTIGDQLIVTDGGNNRFLIFNGTTN